MSMMTRNRWPFNTGDCLIEVTTWGRFDCILNLIEYIIEKISCPLKSHNKWAKIRGNNHKRYNIELISLALSNQVILFHENMQCYIMMYISRIEIRFGGPIPCFLELQCESYPNNRWEIQGGSTKLCYQLIPATDTTRELILAIVFRFLSKIQVYF